MLRARPRRSGRRRPGAGTARRAGAGQAVAEVEVGRKPAVGGQEVLDAVERVRRPARRARASGRRGHGWGGRCRCPIVEPVNAHEPPRAVVFDFNGTISDDEPLLAELCTLIFGEIGIEVTAGALLQRVRRLLRPRDRRARSGRRRPTRPRRRAGLARPPHRALPRPRRDGRDRAPAGRGMRARDRRARAGGGRLRRRPRGGRGRARGQRPARRSSAAVVTADDVARGKPDPEGYLIALERLGVRGADALSFEDTHFGVMAAVAAGMRCVGVGATVSADRLLDAGAEAVVAGLDWSIPTVRGLFA